MQKVLTAEQMREVDRLTTERYGIPSLLLMENAAHAVARVITEKLGGSVKGRSILILCGKGNNGGDGAALARMLASEDAEVHVILYGARVEQTKGDARANFDRIARKDDSETPVHFCEAEEYWNAWEYINTASTDPACIVDAVYGTGLRHFDDALNEILSGTYNLCVAVDIPTGLFADEPSVQPHQYRADVTVTFTAPKPGNVLSPASSYNGELVVADIGSPKELIDEQPSLLYQAEEQGAVRWIKATAFASDSYKNKRGHTLIVAGSDDYSGAAVLAGNAAMRSGVGLVTLAVPRSVKESVASRSLPEVIVKAIDENADGEVSSDALAESSEMIDAADAIAVGCGLSANDEGVEKLVHEIVDNRKVPVIVDAGALWFFNTPTERRRKPASRKPARKQGLNVRQKHFTLANARASAPDVDSLSQLILTPHEGEFLRLLGAEDKEAIKDRVAAVREFSQANNVILVLKGERVLIGEPGGKVVVNPTGNSGLGKAGNGDTLTGILAGFVAQAVRMEIDIFETVVAAVYVAGMAGDVAEKKYGKRVMTASDVRECLVEVFDSLGAHD